MSYGFAQTPAPPVSGWPRSLARRSGPFAPPALPGFLATTNPSAPVPRIGTLLLAGPPPGRSPLASKHRFPRSAQEPVAGITPPPYRLPPGQSAGFRRALSQAGDKRLVSTTS